MDYRDLADRDFGGDHVGTDDKVGLDKPPTSSPGESSKSPSIPRLPLFSPNESDLSSRFPMSLRATRLIKLLSAYQSTRSPHLPWNSFCRPPRCANLATPCCLRSSNIGFKGVPATDAQLHCHIPGCQEAIPIVLGGKKPKRKLQTCRAHRLAASVDIHGIPHRFCQHCTRMHELSEFDGDKHSCRSRLECRNERCALPSQASFKCRPCSWVIDLTQRP